MPATPRMTTESSPTTWPPSSVANSASVRVLMRPPWNEGSVRGRPDGIRVQLREHVVRKVERVVGVDREPAGHVEHEVQALLARHLLDRAAHLAHDLVGRARVLLRRAPVLSPHVLDEL